MSHYEGHKLFVLSNRAVGQGGLRPSLSPELGERGGLTQHQVSGGRLSRRCRPHPSVDRVLGGQTGWQREAVCAPHGAELGELVIVRRYLHDEDDELAQHVVDKFNTPLDWPEDGGLNTEHVVKIAAAAACDVSHNQAANGHLADLFAALPLPGTPEGREFWDSLERAGGQAALYIDPGNAGGPFFYRLINGNEAGIAGRVLNFLEELDDQQRDAAAEVIGGALNQDPSLGHRYLGELWLRDAETTAWYVLLASRRRHQTGEDRKRFLEAWSNA